MLGLENQQTFGKPKCSAYWEKQNGVNIGTNKIQQILGGNTIGRIKMYETYRENWDKQIVSNIWTNKM